MKLRQVKEHINNRKCFLDHEHLVPLDTAMILECSRGHRYTEQFMKDVDTRRLTRAIKNGDFLRMFNRKRIQNEVH